MEDRRAATSDPGDLTLTCVDCGAQFVFTSGEVAYYQSKLLTITKRCPECRKLRRVTLNPDTRQAEASSSAVVGGERAVPRRAPTHNQHGQERRRG